MTDLPWSEGSFLDMLSRRIDAFLQRSGQSDKFQRNLGSSFTDQYEQLVSLLFANPVSWGGRNRPISVVLHTLSRHRPRWLVELCKVSAVEAHRKHRDKITLEDVVSQLDAFGKRRIEDMIAEFRPQCPDIEALLLAFSGQNERYSTDALLQTIQRRILQGLNPRIVGLGSRPTHMQVAQFLFQIGFLSARRDLANGEYEHLTFSDRPNLLRVTTNLDEGMSWEIHPVFRNTLKLKNVDSKSELARRDRKR